MVRYAKLLAGVALATFVAQPFPVQQVCAGEIRAQPAASEILNCLAVQALPVLAFAHQRFGPSADTARRIVAADRSAVADPLEREVGKSGPVAAHRGLEQLWSRPP